jgi:hypothetical protein
MRQTTRRFFTLPSEAGEGDHEVVEGASTVAFRSRPLLDGAMRSATSPAIAGEQQ